MNSLEVRQIFGSYALLVRMHDLGGLCHDRLFSLTAKQAHAITGDHTGIPMKGSNESAGLDVEKQDLHICRVPTGDREPRAPAWYLKVGEEEICQVTDHVVSRLQEHATVHFEAGQPDWDTRAIEDMDDEIHAMEENIEAMHQRIDDVVRRREAARAALADDTPSL